LLSPAIELSFVLSNNPEQRDHGAMVMMLWSFALSLANASIRPRQLAPMSDQQALNGMANPAVAFAPSWSILGPFQLGTRGSLFPTFRKL
jgi:hypothetical protein